MAGSSKEETHADSDKEFKLACSAENDSMLPTHSLNMSKKIFMCTPPCS